MSLVWVILLPIILYPLDINSSELKSPKGENSNNYFEFIYVDANSGQSSGGHTAIKFNDLVYHFQLYPDGIFHLVRESWFDFRFTYNIQENRSLEITRVYPQTTNIEFWENGFNRLYLIQEKHIQNWNEIREDVRLLESNLDRNVVYGIPGLGYWEFNPRRNPDSINWEWRPHSIIGKNYILEERNRLWTEIQNLNWEKLTHPYQPIQGNTNTTYPLGHKSIASEYIPRIQRLALLEAIDAGYRLDPRSMIHFSDGMQEPPTPSELESLQRLEESLQIQFTKQFYDTKLYHASHHLLLWNTILILGEIRKTKDWRFLDTFTDKRQIISWTNNSEIQPLSRETLVLFQKVRSIVFRRELDLQGFLDLQDAANRVIEIQRSRDGLRPIRHIHGRSLPTKKGTPLSYPELPLSRFILKELLQERRDSSILYERNLQDLYPYHLILQNCTSEIFFTFDKIHNHNINEVRNDLGKHIDPLASLSFIPFYASFDVSGNYTSTDSRSILSYRKNALDKLKLRKPTHTRWMIEMRESFVPTSTIYTRNTEDHAFLFFTDNTLLLRPIYGLGNFFHGSVIFLIGLPTYPFDKGKTMKKGIQGVLFSIPEFFFFNINKGSFLHIGGKDIHPDFPNETTEIQSDEELIPGNLD